jgi:hypothetical protein
MTEFGVYVTAQNPPRVTILVDYMGTWLFAHQVHYLSA